MGDAAPFVSIVVTARNEEKRVGRCIQALLALDYPRDRYEVIVVNNGSTDGTGAAIDACPVRRVDEPIPGVSRARNAGIRAARGEIIALTDADCLPESGWLRELLAGVAVDEVGCFAGEIAPESLSGLVERYVHDRRLICQRQLLSFEPRVVAAGNVAYRKAVFDRIGHFEESFPSGEDGEFFWRMQKCSRFRVRYNPRALVSHQHPARIGQLLRRAHREGIGLALFRLKHRGDFPRRMVSRLHYAWIMLRTAAGLVCYPLRVVASRRRGAPLRESLVYPFLDKLCALAREVGILCGLARGWADSGREP